jgi:hypothetical protein
VLGRYVSRCTAAQSAAGVSTKLTWHRCSTSSCRAELGLRFGSAVEGDLLVYPSYLAVQVEIDLEDLLRQAPAANRVAEGLADKRRAMGGQQPPFPGRECSLLSTVSQPIAIRRKNRTPYLGG